MSMPIDEVWQNLLTVIRSEGVTVKPRGMLTQELLHAAIHVDMRRPVLLNPLRGLGYRFMAAEASWILAGDNRVETIKDYSKTISQFSDNGVSFFGAYGPKINDQLDYVINKLRHDPHTRQAVINIWRENPPETKDYPCTIAMVFQLRRNKLELHVFMRSSDAWLGVPYDIFNFSMVAHLVCCRLNEKISPEGLVSPGQLHLTAASSHLYEANFTDADACLRWTREGQLETPKRLYCHELELKRTLAILKEPGNEAFRWWS